jgi:hypothetical protein
MIIFNMQLKLNPGLRHMSNLLIMYGVNLPELYGGQIAHAPNQAIDNEPSYDTIPKTFTSFANWPRKVNLRCWECSETFDSIPTFIPRTPKACTGKLSEETPAYVVHGNFCDWRCSLKHLHKNFDHDAIWLSEKYIEILRHHWPGSPTILQDAPDKTQMACYRGPDGISTAEFRALF